MPADISQPVEPTASDETASAEALAFELPPLPVGVRPFNPPRWMSHSLIQTIMASLKFRKRGPNKMLEVAEKRVMDCEDGARLLGSFSPNPDNKALVILLHGWEGSQDSTYVVTAGRQVYDRGASVFRLNYRDHGGSHDLNEGLFYSTLFNEVFDAVKQAAKLAEGAPVYIVGFSLGGNFALRIARSLRDLSIRNLKHIFAISPVVDPWGAAPLVDVNPLYRWYFLRKWTRSLKLKQFHFPHLYDFSDILSEKRVMKMTAKLLPKYSEYPDMKSYFDAYRVDPHDLSKCPVPVSMITAEDDGIIPVSDIMRLQLNENARRIIHKNGGHNGFFQSVRGPTWYDDYIAQVMREDAEQDDAS
jgi:predicted alpha/beta-fold hydrolase